MFKVAIIEDEIEVDLTQGNGLLTLWTQLVSLKNEGFNLEVIPILCSNHEKEEVVEAIKNWEERHRLFNVHFGDSNLVHIMGNIDLTVKKERAKILEMLDKNKANVIIADSRLGGPEAQLAGLMILDEALSEPNWNWTIDQCYLITSWGSALLNQLFNETGYWPKNASLLMPNVHYLQKDKVYSVSIGACHAQIRNAIERCISYKKENTVGGIIGKSEAMQKIYSLIHKIHPTSSTVLVTGESGTGKELVAKAIHYECLSEGRHSGCRRDKPFLAINCAALPESLLESELFGHEKGAFTGANSQKKGLFEKADGGTVFLDEITEMSTLMQSKLLRFLQEREFRRIGGTDLVKVDIRVICATNKDIYEEIQNGNFREDLFYRINVLQIPIKSLRERREDIPMLIDFFITRFCKINNREVPIIEEETYKEFQKYDWPGNVRQLENCIERSLILHSSSKFEWKKTLMELKKENLQKPISEIDYEKIWKQILSGERKPKKPRELSKEFMNDMLVLTIMAFAIREVGKERWLNTEQTKKYFNETYDNFKQWAHSRGYNKNKLLSLI